MGRGIPPAYVFTVLADRVLLAGGLRDVFRMLKDSSLRDRVSRETASTLAVRYSGGPDGVLDNSDLHALLKWLTEHGVAFAEDGGQEGSVAELGRALQTKGALPRRITSIEWLSPDEWKVREHYVPAARRAMPATA